MRDWQSNEDAEGTIRVVTSVLQKIFRHLGLLQAQDTLTTEHLIALGQKLKELHNEIRTSEQPDVPSTSITTPSSTRSMSDLLACRLAGRSQNGQTVCAVGPSLPEVEGLSTTLGQQITLRNQISSSPPSVRSAHSFRTMIHSPIPGQNVAAKGITTTTHGTSSPDILAQLSPKVAKPVVDQHNPTRPDGFHIAEDATDAGSVPQFRNRPVTVLRFRPRNTLGALSDYDVGSGRPPAGSAGLESSSLLSPMSTSRLEAEMKSIQPSVSSSGELKPVTPGHVQSGIDVQERHPSRQCMATTPVTVRSTRAGTILGPLSTNLSHPSNSEPACRPTALPCPGTGLPMKRKANTESGPAATKRGSHGVDVVIPDSQPGVSSGNRNRRRSSTAEPGPGSGRRSVRRPAKRM